MKDVLTFIIPVRHPENTWDTIQAKEFLTQTIRSISSQESDGWRAVIVANRGTDLPKLPPKFEVCFVDYPPNPLYGQGTASREEWYEAIRIDKGRRLLSGMLSAAETSYFMSVDDDDFVSRRLTGHVTQNLGRNGWYFRSGYLWETGGRLLYLYNSFSSFCGTSHIIRRDLYKLPDCAQSASQDYIRKMLGSHLFIADRLRSSGAPLDPLPFPGAVYRIGGAGSASRSPGLMRKVFGNRGFVKSPIKVAGAIRRFRLLTEGFREEFFGV
ncbi:MAG: hypothetical protein ABR924_10185 [Terracidiphilus sp.]|jgi:hypothetical protein